MTADAPSVTAQGRAPRHLPLGAALEGEDEERTILTRVAGEVAAKPTEGASAASTSLRIEGDVQRHCQSAIDAR